jgi:hypothetical protein
MEIAVSCYKCGNKGVRLQIQYEVLFKICLLSNPIPCNLIDQDCTRIYISVISSWLILLVEETGGLVKNHRPITSHWQTLSRHVVHLALIEIQTHTISSDRHVIKEYGCRSNMKYFLKFVFCPIWLHVI